MPEQKCKKQPFIRTPAASERLNLLYLIQHKQQQNPNGKGEERMGKCSGKDETVIGDFGEKAVPVKEKCIIGDFGEPAKIKAAKDKDNIGDYGELAASEPAKTENIGDFGEPEVAAVVEPSCCIGDFGESVKCGGSKPAKIGDFGEKSKCKK